MNNSNIKKFLSENVGKKLTLPEIHNAVICTIATEPKDFGYLEIYDYEPDKHAELQYIITDDGTLTSVCGGYQGYVCAGNFQLYINEYVAQQGVEI